MADEPGAVEMRARFRCERPSKYAGWLLADGRVIPARCGSPNQCAYCAWMAAVENCLIVGMDAERHGHPKLGLTLTTVDPHHDLARFRKDVEQTFRAVRRAAGGERVEYLGMIEWTTGKGARSGGHRRVHQHLLLRGVPAELSGLVEQVARDVWEARTGASRVECRPLRSAAGATAYVVAHHHKREQAPPPGTRVRRLRHSRGYFTEGVTDLRMQARAMEREKRVRRAARRLVDWDYLDGAPDDVFDSEWSGALTEARHANSMVTFVKLDSVGAIVSAAAAG